MSTRRSKYLVKLLPPSTVLGCKVRLCNQLRPHIVHLVMLGSAEPEMIDEVLRCLKNNIAMSKVTVKASDRDKLLNPDIGP